METNTVETSVVAASGQFAYIQIPANTLRTWVDGLFPVLAKNPGQ